MCTERIIQYHRVQCSMRTSQLNITWKHYENVHRATWKFAQHTPNTENCKADKQIHPDQEQTAQSYSAQTVAHCIAYGNTIRELGNLNYKIT